MILVRARETQPIQTPNGNYATGIATPSRGAQEVSVVLQRQSPGGFNPLHHQNREEIMVQLSGRVTVSSNGERIELGAGDTLIVPPEVLHRVDNTGETEAEWLIISSAGARFFRENGEEARPAWIE